MKVRTARWTHRAEVKGRNGRRLKYVHPQVKRQMISFKEQVKTAQLKTNKWLHGYC